MKLIQGGLIKTMTSGDIPNGQVLIDGGKIVAVGQNLDVPAGTEIIDAAGCIVTPGFVDAHCHIGIHEEATRWEGNDTNEYSSPVTPEIRAIDGINPMDEAFGNAIGGGVTTAVTGPRLGKCAGRLVCGDEALRRLHRRHDSQVSGGDEVRVRREPEGRIWPERP